MFQKGIKKEIVHTNTNCSYKYKLFIQIQIVHRKKKAESCGEEENGCCAVLNLK